MPRPLFGRAGSTCDCESLPLRQSVAVAGQREGGAQRVAAVEQPMEFGTRGLQRGPVDRREQLGVFGVRAAMSPLIGHSDSVCGLERKTIGAARSEGAGGEAAVSPARLGRSG